MNKDPVLLQIAGIAIALTGAIAGLCYMLQHDLKTGLILCSLSWIVSKLNLEEK